MLSPLCGIDVPGSRLRLVGPIPVFTGYNPMDLSGLKVILQFERLAGAVTIVQLGFIMIIVWKRRVQILPGTPVALLDMSFTDWLVNTMIVTAAAARRGRG